MHGRCSEPKEINATSFEMLEEEVSSRFEHPRFRTLQAAAHELREQIREMVSAPMGVDRAYISGLETGERNPTIVTLWHLAQALGVRTPLSLMKG
jgi:hypothetical protein